MRRLLLSFLILACGPGYVPTPNWDGVEGSWVGELVADGGCETLPNPAVVTIDRANRLEVGLRFEGTQCGAVTADVLVSGEAAIGYQPCGSFRVLGGRLERDGTTGLDAKISFEVTTSGTCETTAHGTLARAAK